MAIAVITSIGIFTGCALFSSGVNDIKGKLTGNSYSCYFYDNSGNKFMTAKGDKIGLQATLWKKVMLIQMTVHIARVMVCHLSLH